MDQVCEREIVELAELHAQRYASLDVTCHVSSGNDCWLFFVGMFVRALT